MNAIPLADAATLRPVAERTLLVRAVLAVALVGAIVAVVLLARHPHTQTIVTVPNHSTAIVVLDLSASISADTYARIGATLSSLAHSGGRYGLVVFSDQAYEALPPGTAAADLEPLVRYFVVPPQRIPGFAPTFPVNPWSNAFSAGTKIAAGLVLAQRIAVADELRRPAVILISDLDDDPEDLLQLVNVTRVYRQERIPLRIVALNPTPQNFALFQRLTHGAPTVNAGTVAPGPHPKNHTPFPWSLVLLTLAVAAGLAAGELWGPRLEWGAR
jgi:hypothetical protein